MPEQPTMVPEVRCSVLLDILRAINTSFDLDEILNHLLQTVRSVVPYDAAGIFILRTTITPEGALASHVIAGMAMYGFPDTREDDPMLKSAKGVVGLVIRTGATKIVPDVRLDPDYIPGRPQTRSEIAVPVAVGGKVIGALNLESDDPRAYSKADAEILEFIANAAALSIERALLNREVLEKKRIDGQLDVARQVQASLLPEAPPRLAGYDVAAINIPNAQIGGDYYDYIELANQRMGLAIADVAGKGVPAALIMASFRAALRTQLVHDPDVPGAVAAVNAFLVDFLKDDEFVTAFCAALRLPDGRIEYVNGGHNPPLILRAEGGVDKLDTGGTVLGYSRQVAFEVGETDLGRGDLLVLYTDGIAEARGPRGEEFGIERLERVLRSSIAESAATQVGTVLDAVRSFSGSDQFEDDLTLVILKRE
ncbi:MAG: GAF domain-containing SpoIIE family protein phosphatase [Candidatus Eisenbacteria bacterium]